jgi:superfamily II DNA helicase RecQ
MVLLGLKAITINSQTCSDARQKNKDLLLVVRMEPNVILTGPEQLKTSDFKKTLRNKKFYNRVCSKGFDEVYLLNAWGATFHKDFLQMGFMGACLSEKHNP